MPALNSFSNFRLSSLAIFFTFSAETLPSFGPKGVSFFQSTTKIFPPFSKTLLPSSKTFLVDIKPGMSALEIANLLKDKSLIFNKRYFLFLLKVKKGEGKIKGGVYRSNSKMGSLKIIDKTLRGKSEMIRLTIPEGFTSFDIANLIEEKGLGKKEKFLEIVKE